MVGCGDVSRDLEKSQRSNQEWQCRERVHAGKKVFVRLKRLGWILFSVYVLFLLWLTILSRQPRSFERVLNWNCCGHTELGCGAPDGMTESVQNINNILVFTPFGALFPGKRWKWLLLTVVLLSAGIEAVQYAFNLGWCEIDDVICNALGALIGFGVWKWIKGKFNAVGEKTQLL
jgi:hypothetical protein